MLGWKLRRAFWLGGAAALASGGVAYAGDAPANDAGTKTIADFIAAYAGQAAAPSVKVTPQGSAYLVSFDLAAATSGLKSAGFAYDPVELKFKVYQQDDGAWRVEADSMPPITGHMTQPQGGGKVDVKVETKSLKHATVIDPKLNWVASSVGGADKLTITENGPGVEEFIEFGQVKFDAATSSAADGLTMTGHEPIGAINVVMDIDPKGVDPSSNGPRKPVHISAKGENADVHLTLSHFQPQPLLDVWRFVVAHPEPQDYARDLDAFKTVVAGLVADKLAVNETLTTEKLEFSTAPGMVEVEGGAAAVGATNNGGDSGFSEHFSVKSIKFPDGLIPSAFAAVTPTSFDIGFKTSGFDLAAAEQEWAADVKAGPDGLTLSDADQVKVSEKLSRGRPIIVDIEPSHINGPSLDLAFEGKVTIDNAKPSGAVTIKVRNFDDTAKAIQALGPDAQQKLVPVIAMAKGLAKKGPDGALVWIAELGRDSVIKINGLPLGKAPM